MSELSLSALRNALPKMKSTPTGTEILGIRVYLHRLTAARLIDYEDALIEARTSGNACMASELSVQIIINNLVHPDGSSIRTKDRPTAKELLAAHDNVMLLSAVDKVKKHVTGKLETAEKD